MKKFLILIKDKKDNILFKKDIISNSGVMSCTAIEKEFKETNSLKDYYCSIIPLGFVKQ